MVKLTAELPHSTSLDVSLLKVSLGTFFFFLTGEGGRYNGTLLLPIRSENRNYQLCSSLWPGPFESLIMV